MGQHNWWISIQILKVIGNEFASDSVGYSEINVCLEAA